MDSHRAAPPGASSSAADLIGDAVGTALAADLRRPLVVGICGSQGSGKSTVCDTLTTRLRQVGVNVANLSLDDLYLPRAQRVELSHNVHPLLRTRGVPGTHDIPLALQTFDALSRAGKVRLPRFDKAVDDRRPPESWDAIEGPAEVVLFEGWCVGARPQAAAMLRAPINELEAREDDDGTWRRYVNEQLETRYQALFARIDLLVLLAAPSFDVVLKWRTQQEHALREQAQRGGQSLAGVMDDAAVVRFIQHYERLTTHTLAEMSARADLVIRLRADRSIVS